MMLDTRTDPTMIRAALDHAGRTSLTQAAATFGVSRKAVTQWRDRRALLGPQWPTDQDIADWNARATELAEKRERYRRQAANYRARLQRVGGPLHIDPTGTVRRIQALFALGYTSHDLAPHLGVKPSRVWQIGGNVWDRVHVTTAVKVLRLYDRLSMTRPEGWVADRQRRYARKVGWYPPLAWDDDSIDNPTSTPVGVLTTAHQKASDEIDASAILRRIHGDRVYLTKTERAELASRTRAWGWSFLEIERRTGIKAERYLSKQTEVAA